MEHNKYSIACVETHLCWDCVMCVCLSIAIYFQFTLQYPVLFYPYTKFYLLFEKRYTYIPMHYIGIPIVI